MQKLLRSTLYESPLVDHAWYDLNAHALQEGAVQLSLGGQLCRFHSAAGAGGLPGPVSLALSQLCQWVPLKAL